MSDYVNASPIIRLCLQYYPFLDSVTDESFSKEKNRHFRYLHYLHYTKINVHISNLGVTSQFIRVDCRTFLQCVLLPLRERAALSHFFSLYRNDTCSRDSLVYQREFGGVRADGMCFIGSAVGKF